MYQNKYWDLLDQLFRSNWQHVDAATMVKMMKRYLDYAYDAGPEHLGIIREYQDNYLEHYEGEQRAALEALNK